MGSVFDPLLAIVGQLLVVVGAILAIAAVVASAYVAHFGAQTVLAALRGEGHIYKGKFYSADVWKSAMEDLHEQRRRGGLLDAEAIRALNHYQGIDKPRRRKGAI